MENTEITHARKEWGWELREGAWWAPDPFDPAKFIRGDQWCERTGLNYPEDFTAADEYVLSIMGAVGSWIADSDLCWEIARTTSNYHTAIGYTETCKLRSSLI